MSKKTVNELRKKLVGVAGSSRESVDKHASYGMASISHVSSTGMSLFGSGIKHSNFIELTVSQANRTRNGYSDHYSTRDTIVSVYLSPAQFTGLLTRTNTPGVPCTLNYYDGQRIEEAPEHNIKTELFDDLKKKFEDLEKRVNTLQKEIKDDLKGPVKKADKEKILNNVMKIHQDIDSNLPYLLKCQTEKLEDVGSQMVAEAEATVNCIIRNAGLASLADQTLGTYKKTKRLKIRKD